MDTLDGAAVARLTREQDFGEAEAEVQRMNADRSRLAQELDGSEARALRGVIAPSAISTNNSRGAGFNVICWLRGWPLLRATVQ